MGHAAISTEGPGSRAGRAGTGPRTEVRRLPRRAPGLGTGGSVLLLALVAVAVAASFAVAAGFAVRGRMRAAEEARWRRDGLLHAEAAASRALLRLVESDTNGWDSLDEPWASEPWELREDGWILRVSGDGWRPGPGETLGLLDAERRLPLNTADEALLRAAGTRLAGLEESVAATAARAIAAYRVERLAAVSNRLAMAGADASSSTGAPPFLAVAELARVPGLPEDAARALEPWFAAPGGGKLNLNTASPDVLECALAASSGGDIAAVLRLRDRIRAFREAGGVFTAADPLAISRSLGGIPPDETMVLTRAGDLLCAVSTVYEGVAEARPADTGPGGRQAGRPPFRMRFCWDKSSSRFLWRSW